MFGLGAMELFIVVVVVFIIFGPSLVKRLGRVLAEFRKIGKIGGERE